MELRKKAIVAVLILATFFAGCINQMPDGPMIFVFGSSGDAVRLDPADVTDGESIQRMDNIYEGLVRYKGGTTEIEPCLATDWTVSGDKLTITFNLRQGVQFHHGYGEMTADDVVFSFERQYNADHWYHANGEWAYWGYMFTDVDYVEKLDTYKVAIHLKRPNASIMTSLAMFTVCIVSEKAAQDYGEDYFKNPVGTGPFEFLEWVKDDHITLRAFDDYWGGKAQIDELIFKVIPDPSARLMALQAGDVHGIEHIDPQHIDIIKNDPKLQLISQAGMNVGYIALNCGEGYNDANGNGKWDPGEEAGPLPGTFEPFQDIRVRRAIAHAINKEAIVRNLYQGAASVAVQGMPPSLFGYNTDIAGYEYDPEKAKQLLADAGYPDGFDVTFWHMPVSRPYFPVPTEIAEAIQADLAVIGITATLITEDWGTYLQDTEAGKHNMAMLGWTGDNGDPDNFLNVLYSQDKASVGTAGNIAFKKNPEFQELCDKALATYDQAERASLYKKANALLVDQCSHVFIAHSDQNLGFLATVHDYIIHPTSRKFFYPVWVEEGGTDTETPLVDEYEAKAREFEDAGDWENAAAAWEDIAEASKNAGNLEKAAAALEDAARIWKGIAFQSERTQEWINAANAWKSAARSLEDAAEAWKDAGDWEKAVDAWEDAARAWKDAGEAWEDAGDPENARTASGHAENAYETADLFRNTVKYETEKLVRGQILFYVPHEMKVGIPVRVKTRISTADTQDLPEVSEEYGKPVTHEINVGTFMKANLKGKNFDIEKINENELMVIPEGGFADWEWYVVPLESGSQTLVLTDTVIIKTPDHGDLPAGFTSIDKETDVKSNLIYDIQEFIRNNWKWIIGIITPILSGIFGWIVKKRKTQEKKEEKKEK